MSEVDQPKDYSTLFVDAYFKLPKETFELFTRSVDSYMKLHRAWLTASDLFSKGKMESKELYDVWADSFKNVYDDVFEMLFRPMRIIEGIPLWTPGTFTGLNEWWMMWFKPFETLISLYPKEVPQLFSKIVNAYTDFFSAWREYYHRFYKAWLEASEKLSRQFAEKTVNLQKDPKKMMSFWKSTDIYNRIYAVWTDLVRKNIEVVSENLAELQKATLGTYKGWISLLSVPEEEREKIFNWFTESIKKSLEATTSVINKQLENLAKLLEDLSANIEKLTAAMKAGVATKT